MARPLHSNLGCNAPERLSRVLEIRYQLTVTILFFPFLIYPTFGTFPALDSCP